MLKRFRKELRLKMFKVFVLKGVKTINCLQNKKQPRSLQKNEQG